MLLATLAFAMHCPFANRKLSLYSHADRGWYDNTGFHNSSNPNYVVGDTGFSITRNFFVFDLSSVVQPIASAKLALFVPSRLSGPGYKPRPQRKLRAARHNHINCNTRGWDRWSGRLHRFRRWRRLWQSHDDCCGHGNVVEITLNPAAIAALDSATGLIGIGGSLTTLDGVANSEFTFGSSGEAERR